MNSPASEQHLMFLTLVFKNMGVLCCLLLYSLLCAVTLMIAGAVSMTHRTNYVLKLEWFAYEQMSF